MEMKAHNTLDVVVFKEILTSVWYSSVTTISTSFTAFLHFFLEKGATNMYITKADK